MPQLHEYDLDEPIFIDANIFLFHAFDDPDHGDAATDFLTTIEEGRVRGVTSPLVLDEVFFKILVQEAAAELAKPTIWNIRKALEDLFIDRMDQNEDITAKFMNEDRFREAVSQHLLKEVYERIRSQGDESEGRPKVAP